MLDYLILNTQEVTIVSPLIFLVRQKIRHVSNGKRERQSEGMGRDISKMVAVAWGNSVVCARICRGVSRMTCKSACFRKPIHLPESKTTTDTISSSG